MLEPRTPEGPWLAIARQAASSSRFWGQAAELPVAGVTLVELGDGERFSHMPTVLYSLIADTLQEEMPVLFAERPGGSAEATYLRSVVSSPLFAAYEDDEIWLSGPPHESQDLVAGWMPRSTVDGGALHRCLVPTVSNLRAFLAAHEAAYGPTMLILGNVDFARPYWDFMYDWDQAASNEWGDRYSPEYFARWCAQDFLALAVERTQAPTVLVWNREPREAPTAVQALEDVSLLHVSTWATGDSSVTFHVRRRDSLESGWGASSTHEVPRLPENMPWAKS